MTANDIEQVRIFYSSRNNPRIIDRYDDAITYLREEDIAVEFVDIDEDPRPAQEAGVVTTPTILIDRGDEQEKHIGITVGLADILKGDPYGRSVLYQTGFEAGRDLAMERDVAGTSDADALREVLASFFDEEGIDMELREFSPEPARAEVALSSRDDWAAAAEVVHEQFEAFLGGFFTEVFGVGADASEHECVREGDAVCRFVIKGTEDGG